MDNLGVTAEMVMEASVGSCRDAIVRLEQKFKEKEQKEQDIEDLTKKMLDIHKKFIMSASDKSDLIVSAAMILSKQLRLLGQNDAPDIFVSMLTWTPVEKKGVLYRCDPSRNPECTKEKCYICNNGPCCCTDDPNRAFVDSKGDPILDGERASLEKKLSDLSNEMTNVYKRIKEIDSIVGDPPEVEEWKSKLENIWKGHSE